MNLYLVRHGAADWPHWNKPDDERPLTDAGKKEVARVARLLKLLDVEGTVFSSPLPRAEGRDGSGSRDVRPQGRRS